MVFSRKRTWLFGRPLEGFRRKADLGLVLSMHNWLLPWLLLTDKVQFQGPCSAFKKSKTLMTLAACPPLWACFIFSCCFVLILMLHEGQSVPSDVSSQPDLVTQLLLGVSCAECWLLQRHADTLKNKAETVSLLLEMQMRCWPAGQ